MKHAEQVRLIDTCLLHIDDKTTQKCEQEHFSPVYKYHQQEWFDKEMDAVFRGNPSLVAHTSEFGKEINYVTHDLFGTPIIITKIGDDEYKALINVCRHRGVKLEQSPSGCKNRFVCPYHGWMFSNDGQLKGVPFAEGFPSLDKAENSLVELPLWHRDGFLFVLADGNFDFDFETFWAPLADDFDNYDTANLQSYHPVTKTWKVNWKIVTGGGLETYHFKVTHAKSIAPYFFNNISICDNLSPHFRVTMPRQSINSLSGTDKASWDIRQHSHIVYQVFPSTAFILEDDHLAMFSMKPIGPDQTEITFRMLVPKDRLTESDKAHWQRNHKITSFTLDEDFEIGQLIQAGIKSGANEHLRFGLFEGGLAQLEVLIDQAVANREKG